jgi:filamentous hemagglutinin
MKQKLLLFLIASIVFACNPKSIPTNTSVGTNSSVSSKNAYSLLPEFRNISGIQAIEAVDDSLLIKAKRWQGSGNYPGVDNWQVFEIPANTRLYGGLPGQSEFYSIEQSLKAVNNNKVKYWESLQVAPNPTMGFRPKVGEFLLNSSTKVAVSITLANPQFGKGGAWQVFVVDFKNKLTKIKEINLE